MTGPERLVRGRGRDGAWTLLLLASLFIGLTLSGACNRLDQVLYDWTLRGTPRATPADILIVAIDEESLAALGAWPWPRDRHSALLARLAAGRPRAVIYDTLFVTPVTGNSDARLAAALGAVGRVSLPGLFHVPGQNGRGYDTVMPIAALARAAVVGHADIHPDGDGIVRRVDLAIDGERRWLHAAALAAAADPGVAQALAKLPPFVPRAATAPLRRQGTILVDFSGGGGHIRTVPFVKVLRGELPAAFVTDAYVLVGATAPGLGDQFSTPNASDNGLMPGVEIQAYLLDTLLRGRSVSEAGAALRIASGLAAIALLIGCFGRLRPALAPLAGVMIIAATLLGSALLLAGAQIWLPPAAALLTLAAAQPVWAWRRLSAASDYMVEELSRLAGDRDIARLAPAAAVSGGDRVSLQIGLMRQTIARVRSLRELVATAVQSLPDPTVMVASDGRIALANDAAVALFGDGQPPTPAQIERHFSQRDAPLPGFAPAAFADPAGPWAGEHIGGDGSIRDIRIAPWRDAGGSTIGWVVRFTDISRLRLAERQREEALQLLTHDMRAPQASILALVARHGGELSAALAGRLRHYASRTIELADGFLQLAKADAGNYELAPVDLADALIEAVDDLWPQSSARQVTITTEGATSEHLVNGSRSLLTRALVNLIGNAIKFSEAGGSIACRIARRDTEGAAPLIVCAITDCGVGMDAEVVAGLFDRFRARGADRYNPGGIGLGLAFVHSVVVNHGGTIRCDSRPGAGSCFEISLPALPTEALSGEII